MARLTRAVKLHSILDYRNVLINEANTEKQRSSAIKMEKMTLHMRETALKTEDETVFMRIVTLVTLFFLPGTFVSVSFRHLVYMKYSSS